MSVYLSVILFNMTTSAMTRKKKLHTTTGDTRAMHREREGERGERRK